MVSLSTLARTRTDLNEEAIAHLQRLVGSWGLLSDLCFADLLLFAPERDSDDFMILGQVRPTTSQTVYRADWIGAAVDRADRPLIHRAFTTGEITEGEVTLSALRQRVRVLGIPVRKDNDIIAVLTRESGPVVSRQAGELERNYMVAFDGLASMIAAGLFPFPKDDTFTEETPRVGDGVILLDEHQRVKFSSPNAISALHRVGVHANAEGHRLSELGLEDGAVRHAFSLLKPGTEEVERGREITLSMRCIPLVSKGEVPSALVLLRDISELRRRDLMLLSKDATIREIHHRVKNNLQTIASLLRLQGRRLQSDEAKGAIEESVRRIRAIALVHETLSSPDAGDQPARVIVESLASMVSDSMVTSEFPVTFSVAGSLGDLDSTLNSRLAVILTELLQNAVEHGFARDRRHELSEPGTVRVELERTHDAVIARVIDNGLGLPENFDMNNTGTLGLSIVQTLITNELGGRLDLAESEVDGQRQTTATVTIPTVADVPD